jgi:hypothetical protein
MRKFSYVLSMLTFSAFAGASAHAGASVPGGPTTTDLNLPGIDPSGLESGQTSFSVTPITLGEKSDPQFYFLAFGGASTDTNTGVVSHGGVDFITTAKFISDTPNFGTDANNQPIVNPYYHTPYSSARVGIKSLTPGLPAHGESFTKGANLTGVYKSPHVVDNVDQSGQLVPSPEFVHVHFDPAGQNYIGTFQNSADGGVASITYAAAPEPEAWALLIAGTAMVGGAMRSRRRRSPAEA